jgi:hypothetical protein
MATRRLRLALWQYRRSLRRQAIAQEGAAGHLIGLAGILAKVGRPGTARRLVGIALHLRVKAICLTARANALNGRAGRIAGVGPSLSEVHGFGMRKTSGSGSAWRGEEADDLPGG